MIQASNGISASACAQKSMAVLVEPKLVPKDGPPWSLVDWGIRLCRSNSLRAHPAPQIPMSWEH